MSTIERMAHHNKYDVVLTENTVIVARVHHYFDSLLRKDPSFMSEIMSWLHGGELPSFATTVRPVAG